MAMRSRRGCATCKKRKKKCDEQRPECGQCLSRGVRCGGYAMKLTWSNAVASRGRLAGRAVAETGCMSPLQMPSPPGTVTTGSPQGLPPVRPDPVDAVRQESLDASPPRSECYMQPLSFAIDAEQQPILEKFLSEGIHRLYASTASESIVEAMKDLFPTSEVLRLVCVALQEVVSNGSTVSALEKTSRALDMFRRKIATEATPDRVELFMTGSWICTLHASHIHLCLTLFRANMNQAYPISPLDFDFLPVPRILSCIRHQMETISVLDFPNFVLGRRRPSRGLWLKFRKLQATWDDRHDGGVEPVTGLPRTLLDLLATDHRGTEENTQAREELLWNWYGQTGTTLWECQLWESYKYAGILAIRHQRALELRTLRSRLIAASHADDARVPPSDVILFRMLSSLNAVLNERYHTGAPGILQLQHLALFPLVYGSLQVSALKATKCRWRDDLSRMRDQVMALNPGAKHTLILYEILDEAWDSGLDGFDADEAARRRDVEITII